MTRTALSPAKIAAIRERLLAAGHTETLERFEASVADRETQRREQREAKAAWREQVPAGAAHHAPFFLGDCGFCCETIRTYQQVTKVGEAFYHHRCVQWAARCVCGAWVTPPEGPQGAPLVVLRQPCDGCWPRYQAAAFAFAGLRNHFAPLEAVSGSVWRR